ncbi:MAG: DNA-3-methyladenine glycosylase family protein [Phormidesmis sp.]
MTDSLSAKSQASSQTSSQERETALIQSEILAIAAELSPSLVEAIEQNGPLELISEQKALQKTSQKTPFPERLCRAVTGQQLSIRAADTIWGRVVAGAGQERLIDYFARVEPAALRACGLSGAKAKTIDEIATAALQGQLDSTELGTLSHAERTKRLTALWGVGQWTADMMGIFYFGDPDIWPDGDVTARKTLEKLTSKRRKTVRTAARFAPYRSYLALHMWRYVDATP